jgi:chaperonin GroEL
MINNHHRGFMEYEKPIIAVTEEEIFRVDQIKPFIEHCIKQQRPGIIICSDIGGEALGTLNYNIAQAGFKLGVVVAPAHGGILRDVLEDIAIYVGGNLISDKRMKTMSNLDIDDLGEVEFIKSSYSGTLLVSNVDTDRYHARLEELQSFIKESQETGLKEITKRRLANMTGKTAIIYAWADTSSELVELKDRIDDAVNATKAAMKEGIVPGGGVCLLHALKSINEHIFHDESERFGACIVKEALSYPIKDILRNAEEDIPAILEEIQSLEYGHGYDVLNGKYRFMITAGIIDPAKSIRVSVKNSLSAVKTLLRTDAVVFEEIEKH